MYASFGPKEKFGLSYLSRATAAASTAFPILVSVCSISVWVQTVVWLPESGICNMHTGADACDCTQVLMHVIAHRCWCMWLHTGADACDWTHGCGRVCTESCQRKKRPLSHEGIKPTSVLHLSFWSSALAMRSCLGVSCTSCGRCFAVLAMSSDLQSTIISRSLVVGIWL